MAEKSIFSGIISAIRGGRKQTSQEDARQMITGAPIPATNVPQPLQQRQQDFLNNQYTKVAKEIYTNSLYHDVDRLGACQDYRAMDLSPEVSAAMDIISEECVQRGPEGNILNIYTENARVKTVLKDLFFNRLNVDYNLMLWIREMIKYGDNFILLEIDEKEGIYDVRELPVTEISREESFDGNLKSARFKWDVKSMFFEEWQVGHFRMMNDAIRMPYGKSLLEPARKLWKQLQLAEDAMLVYRIIRAPERRVHYIEVGNIEDADIPQYIERIKRDLKKAPLVDSKTGQINLKFNPMPVWKKTPIPLLDGRTITIEELAKEFEEGKENFVFSIQDKTNKAVAGKVIWCGKNYTAKKLTKVWLDDNTWIMTAPEHPFLIFENEKKEKVIEKKAIDLINGDILIPFYHKISNKKEDKIEGYPMVYSPDSKKYSFVHRFYNDSIFKEQINELKTNKKRFVVHHKDFLINKNSKYNNYPSNLIVMDSLEHFKLHSEHMKEMWKIDKYREIFLKTARENNFKMWNGENSIKNRKTSSENAKKYLNTNETINKRSDTLKIKYKTDDIFYNSQKENLKKQSNDEKNRNIFSKTMMETNEKIWKDEVFIKKHKIRMSKQCYENGTLFKNKEKIISNFDKIWNLSCILKIVNNENIKLSSVNNFFKKEFNINDINELFYLNIKNAFIKYGNIESVLCFLNINNKQKSWFERKLKKIELFDFNNGINHKVLRVENVLVEGEDVYCMTVVGLNGEHDRHNFAIYSFNEDETKSSSGIFVKNSIEEDFYIPIRGDKSSRIETLPGASNLDSIQDVEYLQNKLFAALKIPKTYLNYSENLPGGATLSQADLRFSRTINRIQEAVLMELRRIANIHLHILGFHDDIDNFKISLTNPSTQQELLKLETMKARMEVFKEMFTPEVTAPVSYTWAMENILGFSKDDIKQILRQKKIERKVFSEIEGAVQEYMETGLFSVLDDKFRKTDFVPGALPAGQEGGESAAGLGGGGGGMDLGAFGGGAPAGGAEGLAGGETIPTGEAGGTEVGVEAGAEAETIAENLLFDEDETKSPKTNVLLNKNKNLLAVTKRMIENLDKKSIFNKKDKDSDSKEVL